MQTRRRWADSEFVDRGNVRFRGQKVWFVDEKVWLGGHKIQFGVEFWIRVGDGRSQLREYLGTGPVILVY